jgi:hypothetical protein
MALTLSEINHYTNYWCKSKGISSKDLEQHPRADDLVLLIAFRDAMWNRLNKSEQGVWAGYWSSVYVKKNSLHDKGLKKLEQITITAEHRHLQNLVKQAQQRQRIRQLKANSQNPYAKPVDDMTAKDTGLSQTAPWE